MPPTSSGRSSSDAEVVAVSQGRELLGEARAAAAVVDLRRLVVVEPRADGESQREAFARQRIDRGRLLGQQRGVAQRADGDHRREADALRHGGRRGERRERIDRVVGEPVEHAERRERAAVGAPRPLDDEPPIGPRDRVREADADVHGRGHFTLDSGQQSNIVWRMRANGFEAQPQDLVMTFLGAYLGAARPGRLVRRARHAARRLRLLDGRVARRSGAHGPPRRPRAIAQRPPRLLPPDASHRRSVGGGRPAHLLLGPRAASRGALDRARGTRSRRSAGSSALVWRGACASSASARCRTGCGSRPTTARRRWWR